MHPPPVGLPSLFRGIQFQKHKSTHHWQWNWNNHETQLRQ